MAKKPGMGERACPRCKEVIRVDASVCKHCGLEFSPAEVAEARRQDRKMKKIAGFGCLGLVVLAVVFIASVSGGTPEPVVPEKPGASAKADMLAYYGQVMKTAGGCDNASGEIAAAAKSGDMVAIYQAAERARKSCLSTGRDIAAIELPVSIGKEQYALLQKTRDACKKAYVFRWSAANRMKDVLDEPGKVSAMADLKDTLETAQLGIMACVAGLVETTTEEGATSAEMEAGHA